MDAANGIAGKLAPLVFDDSPLRRVDMYFEVDGTFPNHQPNPLLEENSREIRERVLAEKADLGIAWDGDADRCFFIDESGEFVPGDFVTALLAEALLVRHPGATHPVRPARQPRRARHDPRQRRRAPAEPRRARLLQAAHAPRGRAVRRRGVRSLLLRATTTTPTPASSRRCSSSSCCREEGRHHGGAAGAAAQHVLHQRRDQLDRAPTSDAALARIEQRFGDGEITRLDGVSVDYEHWHFNVRPSNTEPLLRLNLGADSRELMEEKRDLVLGVIGDG